MIDDRNQYEKTKAWLKANQVSGDNQVFNSISFLASLIVYSEVISDNITQSSMMTRVMKYGG